MSVLSTILTGRPTQKATVAGYTWSDLTRWLTESGTLLNQTWTMDKEVIEGNYRGLVGGAYEGNGIVFACMMTRFLLFSQIRFTFQSMRGGRPGDLFGTPDLRIIERPEPGLTTGDLLGLALLDADLAGDWFGVRRPNRIKRLRPDWVSVMVGSTNPDAEVPGWDPDAECVGYHYATNGYTRSEGANGGTWSLEAGEVAHFFPIRDPLARYRGIPLPTAVLGEISGDSAASAHKRKFFEHAATPNLIVKFPPTMLKKDAEEAIDLFEQEHSGALNAYRTMYLLGGADATAVGKDMQQMDFKATQGSGETRIAAALNVHPVVAALSEGMQGSSLNAGNFNAARRLQADKMLRPLWGNFSGSLETILPPPSGSRVWYDERDVPFLNEDVKDAAEVLSLEAAAMRQLGDGGWDHDAVVDAVTSGDLRRLMNNHSGLVPVQLRPPGDTTPNDNLTMLPGGQDNQIPGGAAAARATFTPSSGVWAGAEIQKGMRFTLTHPLVSAFPSMFSWVQETNGHQVIGFETLALAAPQGGQ